MSDQKEPTTRAPRFSLGRVAATPAALTAMQQARVGPLDLLLRHVIGDWGELDPEDRQANEEGLLHGLRLLSNYPIGEGVRIWIITEADRSVTTLLLPEDY